MITARIYKTPNGDICGFSVSNHGDSAVCAAVSALVFTTVNSIECFTKEGFVCDYEESGGFLKYMLPGVKTGVKSHDAELLLKALELGLNGIQSEYKKEIKVTEIMEV